MDLGNRRLNTRCPTCRIFPGNSWQQSDQRFRCDGIIWLDQTDFPGRPANLSRNAAARGTLSNPWEIPRTDLSVRGVNEPADCSVGSISTCTSACKRTGRHHPVVLLSMRSPKSGVICHKRLSSPRAVLRWADLESRWFLPMGEVRLTPGKESPPTINIAHGKVLRIIARSDGEDILLGARGGASPKDANAQAGSSPGWQLRLLSAD